MPHDLDALENKVHGLYSNGAYRVWRKACDRENKACEVVDAADREVERITAEYEARLMEARQHAETVRVEHEQALSRRARVCETMYEALSSRLKFPDGLPSEVAASIQGHARRARRRAAVVSQGWKAWVALAKSKGLFRVKVLGMAAGNSEHGMGDSIICTADGVVSFGRGDSGRLGHGSFEDELTPRLVEALDGKEVVAGSSSSPSPSPSPSPLPFTQVDDEGA